MGKEEFAVINAGFRMQDTGHWFLLLKKIFSLHIKNSFAGVLRVLQIDSLLLPSILLSFQYETVCELQKYY
jgi:hypothetical protein